MDNQKSTAKERLIIEIIELKERKAKLQEFLIKTGELNDAERYLLVRQLDTMSELCLILEIRLAIWGEL